MTKLFGSDDPSTEEIGRVTQGIGEPLLPIDRQFEVNSNSIDYGGQTLTETLNAMEPDFIQASTNVQDGGFGREPETPTVKLRKNSYVNQGIFITPSLLNHRMGRLTYSTSSSPKILNDLSPFFPKAYNLKPGIAEYAGMVARYVAPYGSSANDGLSFDTAYDNIMDAVGDAPDVIFLEPYHYDISTASFGEIDLTKDLCLISVGGKSIISSRRSATWTDNLDGTYTSSSLGGTPIMVMDSRIKTEYGSILKFERLTDNSSVVATPYSWWISGGSGSSQVVTINPGGFVPEDYFTWVMRSANRNVNFEAGDHKFYCENIRWIAGDNSGLTPFNGTENSVFAAVNCSFENAYVNDGLRVQGVGTSISIRCTAQNNSKDGFNYHNGVNTSTDTIQVHFLEVDCVGFDNMETLGTGNGSTAHESCVGIRLNCNYGFNGGPGLVDIGNVMSYNINCTSHNNNGDGNATGVQADNDAQMWLHGGHYGLNRTTDLLAKSSSTIYLCDTRYGSLDFASGIAQFVDFLPESGN